MTYIHELSNSGGHAGEPVCEMGERKQRLQSLVIALQAVLENTKFDTHQRKYRMTNKKTIKNYLPIDRHDLLDVFSEIQHQFDSVKIEISEREKLITNSLEQLKKRVKDDPWKNSELKQNHQFKTKTNKHVEKISRLIETWVEDTENYDKRTEFRSRFGDSLLVFVFGKVKAGKSSLGNFLAYGHSEPSLATIEEASPSPDFFWDEESR